MAGRRRGYIVALEGPEDIVSSQLDLLPESPAILKIESMSKKLAENEHRLARHRSSANVGRFVWGVDCIIKSRFKKAEEFIAAGTPGEVRLVFLKGGAVGASRACTDAIKRHIPSVGGDITRAETYLANVIRDGVHGLDLNRPPRTEANDPSSQAMRAAEELDARTASLQPQTTYHVPHDAATVQGPSDKGKSVATRDPATVADTLTAATQPQSRFSSWDTPSDGDSSGHVSTAQKIPFQQARLVPVAPSSSDPLAHREAEASDVSVGSDGLPRPRRAVREARRQEALMLLEGDMQPDTGYDPVLPMREDLVFLLQEETSSITLDELAGAYKSGDFYVDNVQESSADVEDRFLELLATNYPSPVELQNGVRAELRSWFAQHNSALDLSIFAPILDRSSLKEASQVALASIEEGTDLILAVGCQEGVAQESFESVVGKLVSLGKPDGKSYSRAGRIQFKKLLTKVMVVHTSQPLFQQTDNPFENASTTAEAVLPHIAGHLTSNPITRFLIIDFAQRHIPAVLALRDFLGRKRFKIAGITREEEETTSPIAADPEAASITSPAPPDDAELSPLASNPPARPSFTAADWKMEVNTPAEATERLNLTTKVWRALREADDWYNPGAGDKVDENGNRISIAVTTEGKSRAPTVKRPISIAKRPEGYELGKSNFSRPLVPVSPPDSIPASPDVPPPPPPPAGLPPRTYHLPTGPPSHLPPPPPPQSAPGHGYTTAAPASPEPTIGSSASGSSGSTWKALAQKFKRSGTPSIGGADDGEGGGANRLAKKFSALFSPPAAAQDNPTRGRLISSPLVVAPAPAPMAPPLPPPPPQHPPTTTQANPNAQVTGLHDDDGEEHDEDMDEEERRVLGRFGSRRRRDDEDDKARRMLGLP